MSKKYVVNGFQCVISAVTAVFLLTMAAYCIVKEDIVPGMILLALGILFLIVSVMNGMFLVIKEDSVECRFIKKCVWKLHCEEIKEVGVVGLSVFGSPKRTGIRYIYFSKKKMSEKERFEMCLNWPPKDKLYMSWNAKRLADVQKFWNGEISEYNAGNIGIG